MAGGGASAPAGGQFNPNAFAANWQPTDPYATPGADPTLYDPTNMFTDPLITSMAALGPGPAGTQQFDPSFALQPGDPGGGSTGSAPAQPEQPKTAAAGDATESQYTLLQTLKDLFQGNTAKEQPQTGAYVTGGQAPQQQQQYLSPQQREQFIQQNPDLNRPNPGQPVTAQGNVPIPSERPQPQVPIPSPRPPSAPQVPPEPQQAAIEPRVPTPRPRPQGAPAVAVAPPGGAPPQGGQNILSQILGLPANLISSLLGLSQQGTPNYRYNQYQGGPRSPLQHIAEAISRTGSVMSGLPEQEQPWQQRQRQAQIEAQTGAPQGNFPGMVERGNINLANRPQVHNPDGSISTVSSKSFNIDGKETLLPTISQDGRRLTDQQAIDEYRRTGQHLGKFNTPQEATNYAQALHRAQEQRYPNRQQAPEQKVPVQQQQDGAQRPDAKAAASGQSSDIPAHVLQGAREAAMQGGPGAVFRWMAQNGHPHAGNWCGEFAAAVMQSQGLPVPEHPEIASNWRNWGTPTTTPQAGDVAIRNHSYINGHYVPTGELGAHVTTVEHVYPDGSMDIVGGNQSRMREHVSQQGYDFRTMSTASASAPRPPGRVPVPEPQRIASFPRQPELHRSPMHGARRANDGHWYVRRGGRYYRVVGDQSQNAATA